MTTRETTASVNAMADDKSNSTASVNIVADDNQSISMAIVNLLADDDKSNFMTNVITVVDDNKSNSMVRVDRMADENDVNFNVNTVDDYVSWIVSLCLYITTVTAQRPRTCRSTCVMSYFSCVHVYQPT